jgi:anti-anti-sigma factor
MTTLRMLTPSVEFDAAATVVGGRMVVSVRGHLDIATAPQLRETLDRTHAHLHPALLKTPLVVDMTGVTLIDATGLGALVAAARQGRREGRDTVLRDVPPATLRVLDISGLRNVFSIESSMALIPNVA